MLLVHLQNFPPDANRIITITGKGDAVERAVKMVQDLMTGDPGTAQQVIQKVLGTVSGLRLRCVFGGQRTNAGEQVFAAHMLCVLGTSVLKPDQLIAPVILYLVAV